MRIVQIAIMLFLSVALACGAPQRRQPQSYAEQAESLFLDAEEALDDNNFAYAMSLYRRVRSSYELSSYAVLAELRIGDVHFEEGSYLQAAQAYRQFNQLHPSHPAVPYAKFRIGMSYFEDMPSDFFLLPEPYERELGSTRLARRNLGDFLEEYRDSTDPDVQGYVGEAETAYLEALDRLAGYEFYLAEFYLRRERPIASADHLRALLQQYPSTSLEPEALFLLARCYVELFDVISALETLQTLQQAYPQHDLTIEALGWMDRHSLSFTDIPAE